MNLLMDLTAAYLLGSIPFGMIVARRVKGINIQEHGSRNIGATNVFRVVGKKWGILVFLLDALKGYAAVRLPNVLMGPLPEPLPLALGIAAILGHSFPIWLSFKGGKGVATSFGVFLALSFGAALSTFGVFCVAFVLSRILSVGSLTAAVLFPFMVWLTLKTQPGFGWYFGISLLLTCFIFFTHRENIQRLFRGEEKKLF